MACTFNSMTMMYKSRSQLLSAARRNSYGFLLTKYLQPSKSVPFVRPLSTMDSHNDAVKELSSQVRDFYNRKEKFRISHGSTNSTRQNKPIHNVLDISALSRVIRIDTQAKTALVEPNVPMDRLVEATMEHGLVPFVVMEFPGITVGGGYSGTSGESSSFKHGFFDRTINYVEMILGNGSVITASEKENSDLFHGAAGALGSLGLTTLVEVRLQDARKFVETTYHPVTSVAEAVEKVKELIKDDRCDYVDGILFSKTSGAVISGRMTDTPQKSATIQRFSAAADPWFYLHVKDIISESPRNPITEAIPLADYLFRYDRGGFWVGTSAFEYMGTPFNGYTRWFLDDYLHTRMLYAALHASGQSKVYIVQDIAMPFSSVEAFTVYNDETLNIYPLWLCPLKQSARPTIHPYVNETEADGETPKAMLNVGLWGYCPKHADFVSANRDLELKVRQLGGMKWLYAQTYYEEAEFWEMHDKQWYDALREKYHATFLPSVYDKIMNVEKPIARPTAWESLFLTWPFDAFYGIYKATQSGLYIEARKSAWKSYGLSKENK